MSGRLTERNTEISFMLSDGEKLKNFYSFIAQNPHINLHYACQIVIERPNATVCYSFNEWAAMDRRVTKGRKGIAYYDNDGYKQFVFDANDTHGDNRYTRPILPMKRLLDGLDELNNTELADSEQSDFGKIQSGVRRYLQEQDELTGDGERDGLLIDGIAYSLYSKTGFPKSAGIRLSGLPYSYIDNADFVKEVYVRTDMLVQDIEEAYREKQEEVIVIDDTDEVTVSDEPIVTAEKPKENKIVFSRSFEMYAQNYVILTDYKRTGEAEETHIYIGKTENLDVETNEYDNSDDSLIYVTDRPQMPYLLYGKPYSQTQQELIDNGTFTAEDYAEYNRFKAGELRDILTRADLKFGVKAGDANSGVPFRYPDWQDEPKHPMYPLYKRYMEAQKEKPQAIVMMRLGDFYEMLGDSAVIVSKQLDITLTGRDVGLPERVSMCGIPYHAMDRYLDKILEQRGVVVLEDGKEPMYILSYAEALGQKAEAKEEKVKPELTEITDDEPTPFDDIQPDVNNNWRSELAAELGEMDDGQSEMEAEHEDDEEADENEADSSSDGQDEQTEQESELKEKVKSTPKKSDKGIKDRKRKEKPQPTLLDLIEPSRQSREEQLIEYELKRGSHFVHGKFRIFDKYNENPSEKAFAEFLKKEYGEGGSYVGNTDETHNAKGIRLKWVEKEHPENNLDILLKWHNVAVRIADLIDDDNYFTEQEKQEYVAYKTEQNRQRELRTEEERQRKELIDKFIYSANQERKQRILDEYANTTKLVDFSEFLKNEYGNSEEQGEGYSVTYNEQGIWLFKGENHDYPNRIYLNWSEFADKVCKLIENDRYIEQIQTHETEESLRDLDAEEDADWDELIDAGILKPVEFAPKSGTTAFNRFKELTAGDKAFLDNYQQRFMREPTNSLWGEVEHCTTIANGIYSVSTSGHGGVMISTELAPKILSPEALNIGDRDGRYYCYEEDAAECIPLRELYDKGILKPTDDYFTHYIIPSKLPEAKDGRITFNKATQAEKAEFIKRWNKSIDDSLKQWNGEYWKAYEKISAENTVGDNTNLNGVLDQSELGGAKTRFKGNVAAIRLVNKLYSENRNPTEAEKKILSQFVGWGGLSQAFDENNKQWRREYNELKGLLSQEDYEQARNSTLNAYYTAKDLIGGIYTALNRFGVKGNNRILEPSMGTGNFFGFMPKEIADGSRLYGVELDNLTGRIAAKLYPQANVQIKGFEDTSFPNDKFDIVVGNVPFGGYGVADSAYNRYNFKVHDYFLAKSIDKVKPNGIVAIVTSKGTMDKLNPSARKYVAERAELLGAIRLPNTAFKQMAGTEAVADILFFRKRTERINTDTENIEWLGTGKTDEGYEINNYFINHPEMVLGTLAEEVGLYGGKDVTVKPDGRELSEAIAEAVKNLPQGFYTVPETSPAEESAIEVDYNVKPMCYKADSGRLFLRIGDEMQEQKIPSFLKDAYQRICAMIDLREELHRILDIQIKGCSDAQLISEQSRLNGMYDSFVKKYGELNGQTNTRLFSEDGDSALLLACEEVDKETGKISKADIFSKRTIRPYVVPTSTDDCFEALQISKNERGRVDISYIEELTGKSYDDVLFELGDAVFRNPETTDRADKYSGFETSEEYLSGKVVAKLNTARRYAEQYPEYRANVEALEKVQPTPLTASEISARLGQTWIDKEIYKRFYLELIGLHWWRQSEVELFYNPHDSSWRLDQKERVRSDTQMMQKEVYGTKRAPAYRLFIDCMNLKATTIYDTVIDESGQERRVLNQAETIAAREKQNKIKEEFQNWIFAKPERREELEATYNRLFNQIRLPSYDGSYLKFPEMNPAIELRPHQKDAIHRIISNDQSTLLHHVVGSGKTYTMAASIMKMRQLGLCKKAMVAVPNHLVQQWASEWRKLYPNAKILVATKEDLEKSNRQKFVSKVALGDWDGIIIAQSSFAKIPVSKERQIKKLNEEIASVEETIQYTWDEQGMPSGAVKNLERIKKVKEAQLKKLMDDKNKDSVLTFENLGVDYLYIDEAHYYKNLFLYTKMNNVAGISNAASQRASDLKLKCEYLQELHGNDRGVLFATGTPISNSMTEMYTMQSYLQPSTLKEIGIDFFDGWAANFGETVTSTELAPSGKGYQARTRFAKFTNLPELQTLYRSFADVITSDMVQLDVPEAIKHVINLKPSDTVIELAEKIAERAEIIHSGSVKPEIDNMLKVTSDGKKLALDPRCFVPDSEDEEGSKLNEAAQRIYEIWEDTTDKKGTQIVFCDLSTPKVRSEEYIYGLRFDAYNDLKYKLVQKGIPADEIAFIHDANTDEQKQALFDRVNSGSIRILIGSTEKCGAGTNVQKRLLALHHLDTPYRPSDMEQREGRIIRQGNTNDTVDIYTYVMERTFDSYSYQILENKSRFIQQITRGDFTAREYEDIDETTLSYAEIKAITAANPRIKRKMEVDTEIARLRVLEGQYKKNLYALQDKIRKDFPEDIRKKELLIERVTLDLMHLQASKPVDPEAFEISVNGKVYTDRKEGGKALTDTLYASKPETVVAEYCGFKISMNPMMSLTGNREITLTSNGQYTVTIGESLSGNLTRLDNFIEDLPKRKERIENVLTQIKNNLEIAEEQVKKPFEHREHLAELLKEQAELNAELDLDKREESVVVDDGSDSGDGDNYKMLPTQERYREERIIDNEDKVAAMKIEVLPDYSITQDEMHEYGYKWDGMLPLNRRTALKLWGIGLAVCKLGKDDDHTEIDDYRDFNGDSDTIYGIEKPVWKRFIENEKSVPYLMARLHVVSATSNMISDEMKYIDDKFIGEFKEQNFKERANLEDFLPYVEQPENDSIKPYLPEVLDEVIERIWREEFKMYGWTKDDVTKSIAAHIADEELKDYVKVMRNEVVTEQTNTDNESRETAGESVYLQTGKYAFENNQIEEYRASHKANEDCKHAIDKAIRENYDGMHLNDGFEKKLIDEYGMERVAFIVATTINEHEWDGRYSRTNKDWAKTIPMSESEDERSNCILNVHPAVLDGFADRIRKKYLSAYERPAVFYACKFEKDGIEDKSYMAVYLDNESGEIKTLLGNNLRTENEIDALVYKVNHDEKNRRDYTFVKKSYEELLSISKTIKKEENTKLAQDKYLHFTARGDKVLSIVKDRDDRNIAIIQREKMGDYVVAARYDTTDGTWGAGKYDLPTLEAAEKYRTEKYGFENTSDTTEKKWLTCKVSPEALIKKYQFNSRFMMPQGSGYEGYAYSIFNDRIKEGTITTDLKSDTRERALVIRITDNQNVELSGNGKTIELDPHEFISLVNETTSDKYEREQRYTVGFPPEAFIKEYGTSMLLAMPNDTKYKGYVYYLPKSVISEDKYSDDGTLIANIGESFKVTLRKGEERVELTAKEYLELVGDKKADRYNRAPSELDEYRQQGEDDKKWNSVKISENAVIANYKETTLFKMPKGDYAGFVYYIPSGMVRKEDDGLYLRVPEDFVAHLKGGDEKKDLTAQELIAAIEGKTDEDYESVYRKPSEEVIKQFEKVEGQLRKNVPEEMLKKPNWVVVRTRENKDTGRLDKFLINPHTGKFAESDNPETWADFDTACKYAKEQGGVCLAYALDDKDGIACIDLDGCMQENGDFSDIAQKAFIAASGSYAEKSVSGKGLHIFGKTKGADLRSFSKDKTMEYYQSGHFIAMTGDNYGSSELKSFDTPEMQTVLESKLEKRTEWKHTGEGVEGLSSMDDREMLDKAFKAKNGDTVKRLYNGEDLRGNHSNSDMSLMNYLAFWSNHDIDQMLRVFATSGLYRADKPQSYYEHTAIKAVKGTPVYTPPKASNNKPSGNGNGSGKDSK